MSSRVAGEVRAHLARKQLSGVRAAAALGWSQTYMSRRLSGKAPFTVDDLDALAQLLSVSATDFFPGGAGRVNERYPRLATGCDRNRPDRPVERSTTIAA